MTIEMSSSFVVSDAVLDRLLMQLPIFFLFPLELHCTVPIVLHFCSYCIVVPIALMFPLH